MASDGTGEASLAQLAWLLRTEWRNRFRSAIAKLRSARHLLAVLAAVAYFGVLFLPQMLSSGGGVVGGGVVGGASQPPWLAEAASLAMGLWLLFWWVRGGYQDALAFSPAETHLLFTAPFHRPTLLRYKLLRAQGGVLATVLILWYFRGGSGALPVGLSLLGLWLLLTTLHLHQVGASLVRVTAAQGRGAGARRVAIPLVLLAVLAVAIVWAAGSAIAAFRTAAGLETAIAAAGAALDRPAVQVALWPLRALLGPGLATDATQWLRALPPALALLAAHYVWVMRTDAAFEEAAAEAGRRRAERIRAVRSGRGLLSIRRAGDQPRTRRLKPPLSPTGEPAVALVWKHVLALAGGVRPVTVAIVVAGGAVVFVLLAWTAGSVQGAAAGTAAMAAVLAAFGIVFGPVVTRYDLRRDLEHVALLRTYPIESAWLVGAEVAATTLVITGVEYLLLGLTLVLLPFAGIEAELARYLVLATVLTAVAAPGLTALQVAVHNGLVLLFPEWVRIGPGTGRGIEAFGQTIVNMLGGLAVFVILLVPVGLAVLLFTLAFGPSLHGWAVVPGVLAGVGALWLEVVLLVRWLARVYDRLDPPAAGLLR